jgi:hypothetical protein
MKTIVTVLVVLGGVLPALSLLYSAWRVGQGLKDAEAVVRDNTRHISGAAAPESAYERLDFLAVDLARAWSVVRATLRQLKLPVLLTAAGLLCGTAGGVWSLYLPAGS